MFNSVKTIKRVLVSAAIVASFSVPASASGHIVLESAYDTVPPPEAASQTIRPTYPSLSSGFKSDDATIGAAGMLGLLGLIGVGSQQFRRRRDHAAAS